MKRIAILEYVGCQDYLDPLTNAIGDISNETAKKELLREGDAMLLAVAKEWIYQHEAEVHCCRHQSLGMPSKSFTSNSDQAILDCVQWHSIRSDQVYLDEWLRVARVCDQAMVVAPEIDGILLDTTRFLRAHGIKLVNANDQFITTASDKWLTAECWHEQSIRQPMTLLLCNALLQNTDCAKQSPEQSHPTMVRPERMALATGLDFATVCPIAPEASAYGSGNTISSPSQSQPWVIKPRDGAGGIGVRRFCQFSELLAWTKKFGCESDNLLLQPWIPGRPASIALVFQDDGLVTCMPARDQILEESSASFGDIRWAELGYLGSGERWLEEHQEVAERFARSAIAAIPGEPRGWIGLDFLCDGSPMELKSYIAIEVNPRLTSSYCFREL